MFESKEIQNLEDLKDDSDHRIKIKTNISEKL